MTPTLAFDACSILQTNCVISEPRLPIRDPCAWIMTNGAIGKLLGDSAVKSQSSHRNRASYGFVHDNLIYFTMTKRDAQQIKLNCAIQHTNVQINRTLQQQKNDV